MAVTAPAFPTPGSLQARVVNRFVGLSARMYRLTGGRIGSTFKGAPVMLLEHVGRKSGQLRTAPVLYLTDGTDLVTAASRGGSDAMPAWWLNLKARPETTVLIGRERRQVIARQATAEEKAQLWPKLVEMYPDYAVYQTRTTREIPVVILSPRSA